MQRVFLRAWSRHGLRPPPCHPLAVSVAGMKLYFHVEETRRNAIQVSVYSFNKPGQYFGVSLEIKSFIMITVTPVSRDSLDIYRASHVDRTGGRIETRVWWSPITCMVTKRRRLAILI